MNVPRSSTDLLIWGVVLHLIVDWCLQNSWQADNKRSLKHPAAYVHAGTHFMFMLVVFPLWAAAVIGMTHLLIDTRRPLEMWARVIAYRQDLSDPAAMHITIWRDQVAHIMVIAAMSLWVAH